MRGFHYGYILVSESDQICHYTGLTSDLGRRIAALHAGQSTHTTKHRTRRFESAIAFRSHTKAAAFERNLKTHSGRAFAKKRF